MKSLRLIVIIALTLFLASCKTFLSKDDYIKSTGLLREMKYKEALNEMPLGEGGTFIITMEKTFLKLLAGNPDIDELQAYVADFDTRIRFKVSRELKSFFYLETPEGYYASEHEIIWLHILLSWGYSLRKEYEKARVETRKVSDLLRIEWSSEGRFDDPILRVILAGLWSMCGDWGEAQVHFRAAHKIDPTLTWAETLGGLSARPRSLLFILGGPGPEPEWKPEIKANPFRGFRGILFRGKGKKSTLAVSDGNGRTIKMEITPDSSNWYIRHFNRDNAIQNLILDSRYGIIVSGAIAKSSTINALGIAGFLALSGAGVGIAAGSFYYVFVKSTSYISNAEGLLVGSLLLAGYGIYLGVEFLKTMWKKADEERRRELDTSYRYRFVRFLPEYAWVGWSMESISFPVTLSIGGRAVSVYQKDAYQAKYPDLIFGYYPDPLEKSLDKTSEKKKTHDPMGKRVDKTPEKIKTSDRMEKRVEKATDMKKASKAAEGIINN